MAAKLHIITRKAQTHKVLSISYHTTGGVRSTHPALRVWVCDPDLAWPERSNIRNSRIRWAVYYN